MPSPAPSLNNFRNAIGVDATTQANLGKALVVVDPYVAALNRGDRFLLVEELSEEAVVENAARNIATLVRTYTITAFWPERLARDSTNPAHVPEVHGNLRNLVGVLINAGYVVGVGKSAKSCLLKRKPFPTRSSLRPKMARRAITPPSK